MKINRLRTEIQILGEKYHKLVEEDSQRSEKILRAELPEAVYNSCAMGGSTLMLDEVKSIILKNKVKKGASVREIYLAKNLSLAMELAYGNLEQRLSVPLILELNKKFFSGVDDVTAGQLRVDGRRASGAETGPELAYALLENLVKRYNGEKREFFEKIAFFHAEFLAMRPLQEGNEQIAQLILNKELMLNGFPPIIIQNKSDTEKYREILKNYRKTGDVTEIMLFIMLNLTEALRKYIAIFEEKKAISLGVWAKKHEIKANIATNKAKRQSIPAFRRDGRWQIAEDYTPEIKTEAWGEFIATPV